MAFHDELRLRFERHLEDKGTSVDVAAADFDLTGWYHANKFRTPTIQEAEQLFKALLHMIKSEQPISVPRRKRDELPVELPTGPNSPWRGYCRVLERKGWTEESLLKLGNDCRNILGSLVRTHVDVPPRELVIGRVQSGKTANIAGVIALAHSRGFNVVVVLSGTIDNLRVQTRNRLAEDLCEAHTVQVLGNDVRLARIDTAVPTTLLPAGRMIVYTCLKNPTRLDRLKSWLDWVGEVGIPAKVLVIDDEADQAGINVGSVESDVIARINNSIKAVVHHKPSECAYLAYTATPYANILNEGPDRDSGRSLYPRHRIHILSPGPGYQGCESVYGREADNEGTGEVPISRHVAQLGQADLNQIAAMHEGDEIALPHTLQDALAWFSYTVAVRRQTSTSAPTSMMIHTSQRRAHHGNVRDGVFKYLMHLTETDLRHRIGTLWSLATRGLTDAQKVMLPNPDGLDFGFVNNVRKGIERSGESTPFFHRGIHLVLENSESRSRLAYPDSTWNGGFSPAFVIVGGNTLARGLTLEGLTASYFLRAAGASDTLMQMGRWFGYRKGYELLPRVWNTAETIEQFRFLSRVEHELRKNILSTPGLSPQDVGPMILSNPEVIAITAKSRMQDILPYVIVGASSPQSIYFTRDQRTGEGNVNAKNVAAVRILAEKLLGAKLPRKSYSKKTVFLGAPTKMVTDLMRNMHFHPSSRLFSENLVFADWLEKTSVRLQWEGWSVAFVGPNTEDPVPLVGDLTWTLSRRSAVAEERDRHETRYYIKTLRDPADLALDFDNNPKFATVDDRRAYVESEKILRPLLLLYLINGQSKSDESKDWSETDVAKGLGDKKEERCNLDSPENLVGISLIWPGGRAVTENVVSVKLPTRSTDEGDLPETDNDEPTIEIEEDHSKSGADS